MGPGWPLSSPALHLLCPGTTSSLASFPPPPAPFLLSSLLSPDRSSSAAARPRQLQRSSDQGILLAASRLVQNTSQGLRMAHGTCAWPVAPADLGCDSLPRSAPGRAFPFAQSCSAEGPLSPDQRDVFQRLEMFGHREKERDATGPHGREAGMPPSQHA